MCDRVIVINQYFPPDIASTGHIAEAICEAIAARGPRVTVVAGQPSYTESVAVAPAVEHRPRLEIRRVPMGRRRGRTRMSDRLIGYARFLWGALSIARRLPRPDLIVTFHNPPALGLLGAWLARRARVPFVYIVQDIHPDILIRTGRPRLPRPLLAGWGRLSRVSLHGATRVITLSEAMKGHLVDKYGVRPQDVVAIPLWAQPDLDHLAAAAQAGNGSAPRPGPPAAEDLVVLYAGNMGVMHPVELIVQAAARTRELPVSFVFVGGGARRRELVELAASLELTNVRFLPFQPIDSFERLIRSADICAVALLSGLEDLCLPSRTPTFLSAGKPILAVMDRGAPQARELSSSGAGWSADSTEDVVRVLSGLVEDRVRVWDAGVAARALYRTRYMRDAIVATYVDAILKVCH